jgi:hypothetical protein
MRKQMPLNSYIIRCEQLEAENARLRAQLTQVLEGMPHKNHIIGAADEMRDYAADGHKDDMVNILITLDWLDSIAAMDIEREAIVEEGK